MSFSSVISDLVPLEWLLYHLNVNKLGFRRTSSVLLLISYYPFNRAKEIRKRLKTEKRWIVIRPQMPVRARAQISRPGQLRRVFLIVYKAMRVKLYPNICSICPVIDNIKPFHCQTCHDYTILAIKNLPQRWYIFFTLNSYFNIWYPISWTKYTVHVCTPRIL